MRRVALRTSPDRFIGDEIRRQPYPRGRQVDDRVAAIRSMARRRADHPQAMSLWQWSSGPKLPSMKLPSLNVSA
jgi:hypothetical protein